MEDMAQVCRAGSGIHKRERLMSDVYSIRDRHKILTGGLNVIKI